jgi:2-polyprenyl-3-methyl-5-hydroxy-6-metoxy-1,4-benzoquinol methylase
VNEDRSPLDRHAQAYSKAFPYFEENRIVHEDYGRRIAQRIKALQLRQVLSLGVGHSEVARPILQMLSEGGIRRYVIVDAAATILNDFGKSIEPHPAGLSLIESYFEEFDDAAGFDAIEAGFVLEHVDDPAAILMRLRRLLHPEGRLFVAVPNACSLHRLLGHHAGLLPDLYALSDADMALGHMRYFDVPRLTELAQSCGWRIESTAGLLLKPFTTGQLAKLDLASHVWRALQVVAEPYPEISNSFSMELSICD